jgi:hemerythrin-like domain-containing protein
MGDESLVEALEREHREIDAGIEAYTATADVESLHQAMSALRRHIYLEEEFLFPPLREAGMLGPVMVMLREHGELWHGLDALSRMLGEAQSSDRASSACRAMLAQLAAHNAKEEPIVYPQAEQVLSPDATAELQEFIRSGELPPGWVCERGGV